MRDNRAASDTGVLLQADYRRLSAGGGAYIVGADNLGEIPGLAAASSLTVGYILTVAVSSCSGAAAVVSAFPALGAYKAWIAFAIVCLLTWGNLRGMRESAVMFGVPTYFSFCPYSFL